MSKRIWGLVWLLPVPVMALDLEAISRGLVEAGPWGKNADTLPLLLLWLAGIVLTAIVLKVIYTSYDKWHEANTARQQARQTMEQWVVDIGTLLQVTPPASLKRGVSPALSAQYRLQVKRALEAQLRHNRELAAQLAESGKE